MITSSSRYANNTLTLITNTKGVQRTTILPNAPQSAQFSYATHTITGYDRLDNLANTYLGDPSLWWQIADINPDITIDWSVLPVGKSIRIPAQ